jgi:hypothetical protein
VVFQEKCRPSKEPLRRGQPDLVIIQDYAAGLATAVKKGILTFHPGFNPEKVSFFDQMALRESG